MSFQYNANDDLEIHSKIIVISEHFAVDIDQVECQETDDPEEFKIKFSSKNILPIECVHVFSETFKDIGCSAYSKLMGNNYYYFRLL